MTYLDGAVRKIQAAADLSKTLAASVAKANTEATTAIESYQNELRRIDTTVTDSKRTHDLSRETKA